MKIIQINSVCNNSSTGRLTADLSIMMDRHKIDNQIIFGIKDSAHHKAIKIGSRFNVKWHILQSRLFGRHSFYSRRITLKIIKYISEQNPDIVHLHQMHGGYINIKLLFEYLAEAGVKVLWTIHDCWPLTGHCAHFESIHCSKWLKECNSCPQYKLYPKSWFFDRSRKCYYDKKHLYENVDITVVTPSEWLYRITKKSILKEKQILCIYNWVDTDCFYPSEKPVLRNRPNIDDKFVVLSIYKCDKSWINKYNRIADNLSDDECLVIAGVDEHTKKMLSKKIITLPFLNAEQLAELYSAANVYLLASVQESFGLTIAESMACGTPVIGYNATAIPEVIGDTDCGEILSDYSVGSIISAVRKIKCRKGEDYRYNCVSRVRKYFDKNKNLSSYIHVYEKLYSGLPVK